MRKNIRILYFTFIIPSEKFGGGIAALQSLHSLCSFADVDYMGPAYDATEFQAYGIKIKRNYVVKPDKNKTKRLWNFVSKGISTSYYEGWFSVMEKIDPQNYDCCYLDYTRQDFVVKWAHESKIPIIVRAHNVEADYFESLYQRNKSPITYLHKIIGKRAEYKCISRADKVLVLTENDKRRFKELYGKSNNITLFPICVKYFDRDKFEKLPKYFISITGSLWFGPNADGTEWFLENVWKSIDKKISEKYALVIAGSNPNNRIRDEVKKLSNVFLYSDPANIDAYYQQAALYIAPIFYGAGMKVKIAEALSCGLPVITTSHAATGYEAVHDLIYISDNAFGFKKHIENILSKTKSEMEVLKGKIQNSFEKNYSLKESCKKMENVVRQLTER